MNTIKKIKCWIKDPKRFLNGLLLELSPILPDKFFLNCMVRLFCGYWPNWKNPQTFNEKIQWLKLYNRRPEYTEMVDKYAVKDYVAKIIGEKYVIPTLGVWNRPEDIDWNSLPESFVLKTTHGGGNFGVVICKDKATFDRKKAIEKLNKSLKQNIYRTLREWPYKNVPHRIIAEQFIDPRPNVKDCLCYRWYCFNGDPNYCQVIHNRSENETFKFFDINWEHIELFHLNLDATSETRLPSKPANLLTHLRIARELSKDLCCARIDLYETGENNYFAKVIDYPMSDKGKYRSEQRKELIGEMANLSGKSMDGLIITLMQNDELQIRYPDLPDYKFFCFGGTPRIIQLDFDRISDHKKNLYSIEWDLLPFSFNYPSHPECHFDKPSKLDEMVELARKLSKDLPFSRIDFYWVNGKILFGEITFFPASGLGLFNPPKWDTILGDWISLPEKRSIY